MSAVIPTQEQDQEFPLEKIDTPPAMSLPQRAAVALRNTAQRAQLSRLVKKSAAIQVIKNKDGRDECHSAMMVLVKTRTGINSAVEDATEDAKAFVKAVKAEAVARVAIIQPEETRLRGLRDGWDEEQERIKQAAIAAELARTEAIAASIAEIKDIPRRLTGKPSGEIQSAMNALSERPIGEDEFQESTPQAMVAKDDALQALQEMFDAAAEAEREAEEKAAAQKAEAERIAAERAELERLKAEEAERARVEAEKLRLAQEQFAAEQAEAKRLRDIEEAARAAEIQRQQEELTAQRAELERLQKMLQAESQSDLGAPGETVEGVVDTSPSPAAEAAPSLQIIDATPACGDEAPADSAADAAPAACPDDASSIVRMLAEYWNVSARQAQQWLIATNFQSIDLPEE